jgi:hypothetical protein
MCLLVGFASPGTALAGPPESPTCVVHSLPSFTAQGEFDTAATVADVIEVECNPTIYGTGSKVKITASQLFSRCKGDVTWYVPNPFHTAEGRGVTVEVDADGNATVAVLAGPGCAAGESLVTAHLEEEPFETFTTSFTVLPPTNTTPGVFAMPSSQVEDALSSAVATVVEVEFKDGSEKHVHIGSEEFFDRCRVSPHLHWVRMDREVVSGTGEVEDVELDNNGNGFVIAIGDASCAEGPSLIEADLESKPFTTFTTTFTVLPPQPTAEPSFTIEKRQAIAGTGGTFTTSPLAGVLGQTVDYQILVTNTSHVAETFSEFIDAHCDPGTIAGGPGSTAVEPGHSTTYTCRHLLTAPGAYTNEASVTGTTVGGEPLSLTSNRVVVDVPELSHESVPGPGPAAAPTAAPHAGNSGASAAAKPKPSNGQVLSECIASRPVLHGASGAKHGVFTLQIGSRGIKQITFYLDGHKLRTLSQSQAKRGVFTLKVDPRRLSYGAHRLSVATVMTNRSCARIAASHVFVHARAERITPKFTG